MPDGADTTRDAVAAAFKEVSARSEPAPAPEPAPDPSPSPEPSASAPASTSEAEPKAEPQRDGKGRFIVPPKTKPAAPEKAPASTVPAGQGGAAAPSAPVLAAAPPASTPALEALKPPQNLRAMAREKWATLPREMQEEFVRLQHESSRTLAESVATRKAWDTHQQAIAPYEGMIRAEGLEPAQAVGLLLQREAALRTAPMATRAQIIAHGIRTFLGTDEAAINLLAQALDSSQGQGQQRPQAPQQFDPNQLIAQAEQRLMQRLETSRNEMVGQSAQTEMDAFAQAHEFMDEPDPETGLTVADEMASLMEAAAAKNKILSPDDAYKRATRNHSTVSKVIAQREAAKAATAKAATTQAARAASSSIKSEPAGPSNGKTKDIRETVAEAYYAQKNAH
jgi:hypothetical protein